MTFKVLVTGGAGFIGSFLTDELINLGHQVTVFDNLEPQVHPKGKMPDYVNKQAKFIKGDMTNIKDVEAAVKDSDIIFHKAAMVGVGQSMYQISRYVNANSLGTANLLDILINKNHSVKKLIVASSMSTYGEGTYLSESGDRVRPPLRSQEQMEKGEWEIKDPITKKALTPVGIKESDMQNCNSIYGITKKDQEVMVINIGKAYGIPSVALRYFNVYGPRQSLNNPYTGVAAIFISRLKNNNPPLIFEDGFQTRDFISVHDIVDANILSMKNKAADFDIFNVGTGIQTSLLKVADTIAKLLDKEIPPNIVGKFRKGDIRHCFSDISKIQKKMGFTPKISFHDGMKELIAWANSANSEDMVSEATKELEEKGLIE